MENYGLSMEDYEKLLKAQDGACAICGGKRKYNLQVDHCHKTEAVRGLLCKSCNKGILRSARDNPQTLRNAASYLENYPVDQILGRRYTPNGPKGPFL
ncbi:endonuclease VII domain-containing protein [Streptomyces sp. NPDC056210]|uniref:endonuclease VII domain-containing protein n=1 Tax=Streptomyces sp. NPDC056210 TaxID=3345746 RepID=UPI0035DBB859